MKISELNTKSFLGAAGAAANSYVLINYEDNTTNEPVTYKATLDELGKSIASNLHLYKETANGAVTTNVSNGAYTDGVANSFITSAERTSITNMESAITLIQSTMATAVSMNDIVSYVNDENVGLVFATETGISQSIGHVPKVVFVNQDGKLSYYADPSTTDTAEAVTMNNIGLQANQFPVYVIPDGENQYKLISNVGESEPQYIIVSTFTASVIGSLPSESESEES